MDQAAEHPATIHTAYATAHYGKSLFWYTTELLFSFYLAEIYKIPPTTLGTLLFVFLIWDAITDPWIGTLLGKANATTKYLLWTQLVGAIASSFAFILVFFKPNLGASGLLIYALLVGLLFRTAYTIFDVPQNALLKRLARSDNSRLTLSSLRAAFSAVATLTVSLAAAIILSSDSVDQRAFGFTIAAFLFVGIAIISALALFLAARGSPGLESTTPRIETKTGSFKKTISDPSLLRLFLAIFFLSVGWPLFGKLLPFFATYVLGDAELTGFLIAVMAVSTLISQPVWVVMGRTLRRKGALVGSAVLVTAAGLVFTWYAAGSVYHASIGVAMLAATTSAMGVFVWAMLADQLSEADQNPANDVIAFAIFTFSSKAALGLGGLLLGFLLHVIGYQAGVPMAPEAQMELVVAMGVTPVLTTILATTLVLSDSNSSQEN